MTRWPDFPCSGLAGLPYLIGNRADYLVLSSLTRRGWPNPCSFARAISFFFVTAAVAVVCTPCWCVAQLECCMVRNANYRVTLPIRSTVGMQCRTSAGTWVGYSWLTENNNLESRARQPEKACVVTWLGHNGLHQGSIKDVIMQGSNRIELTWPALMEDCLDKWTNDHRIEWKVF